MSGPSAENPAPMHHAYAADLTPETVARLEGEVSWLLLLAARDRKVAQDYRCTPTEATYVARAESAERQASDLRALLALVGRLKRVEEVLALANSALTCAVVVANEARDEWDAAPSGMKAGKLLIALSGNCPGYRSDIDSIHAVRERVKAAPTGGR